MRRPDELIVSPEYLTRDDRVLIIDDFLATGATILGLVRLARAEGIVAALESAHAVAWVIRAAADGTLPAGSTVLLTLSGRGDKDISALKELL